MSRVQSILFKKKYWNMADALNWLLLHDYRYLKVDDTPTMYRFRQEDPYLFNSFKIKKIKHGHKSIDLVIGFT